MKEPSEEISLLNQAVFEIKSLRRQNELMKARLDMFDTVNKMLNTSVPQQGSMMSPDLCYQIERFVERKDVTETKEANS